MLDKKTSDDIEYFCYKNRTTKLYKGFKKKDFENKVWVSQDSLIKWLYNNQDKSIRDLLKKLLDEEEK